jgi:hypothetical protein
MKTGTYGYPRSRDDARQVGSIYYETGKPCKRGHRAPRFVSTCICMECNKLAARKTYTEFLADDEALDWR